MAGQEPRELLEGQIMSGIVRPCETLVFTLSEIGYWWALGKVPTQS